MTDAQTYAILENTIRNTRDETVRTYLVCALERFAPSGENYGRTANGELIGPYDTVAELDRELDAANRESGYTHCACRDCMDVSISTHIHTPELCLLCKGAECDATGESECNRDDAYATEDEVSPGESPDPHWMNP